MSIAHSIKRCTTVLFTYLLTNYTARWSKKRAFGHSESKIATMLLPETLLNAKRFLEFFHLQKTAVNY